MIDVLAALVCINLGMTLILLVAFAYQNRARRNAPAVHPTGELENYQKLLRESSNITKSTMSDLTEQKNRRLIHEVEELRLDLVRFAQAADGAAATSAEERLRDLVARQFEFEKQVVAEFNIAIDRSAARISSLVAKRKPGFFRVHARAVPHARIGRMAPEDEAVAIERAPDSATLWVFGATDDTRLVAVLPSDYLHALATNQASGDAGALATTLQGVFTIAYEADCFRVRTAAIASPDEAGRYRIIRPGSLETPQRQPMPLRTPRRVA